MTLCGDPLGERKNPVTKCTEPKAHKGLHTDQDKTWAGNNEVAQEPQSQWEEIQRGDRNGSMTLVAGTPHRLPAINYKSGWSFYWVETYEVVELSANVTVSVDGRLVRKHLRKFIFKVWLDAAYFDILTNFIQHFITEFELDLMKDQAFIDGKPLWELTK